MPWFEVSLFQLFLSMRQTVTGIRKISVSKIIDVFFSSDPSDFRAEYVFSSNIHVAFRLVFEYLFTS